jgi:ankyrin repeat protein
MKTIGECIDLLLANKFDELKKLFPNQLDINLTYEEDNDVNNDSLLIITISLKKTGFAHFLCENGADIHHQSMLGTTAFTAAIINKEKSIVNKLLAMGATFPSKAFELAWHGKKKELLEKLNHDNTIKKARDTAGHSLLHYAICGGHGNLAKNLIALGFDPLEKDSEGFSGLALCASHLPLKIFKSIFNETCAYEKDEDDNTLLHYSLTNPDIHVAKWLANTFPDLVNAITKHGNTVLHNAVREGKLTLSLWFAKKFPFLLHMKTKGQHTPFGLAACYNHHKIAKWLIKHFPDCLEDEPHILEDAFPRNRAPLFLALSHNNLKILELLYQNNKDCIYEYYDRDTSFFSLALCNASLKTVEWFLSKATLECYYENDPIDLCYLLYSALCSDKKEIIELIHSKIPHPINQPVYYEQQNLLHLAIKMDLPEVVKWLLSIHSMDKFPAGNLSYFDHAMYAPITLQYLLSTYPKLALNAYKDDPSLLSKYIVQRIEEAKAKTLMSENKIACIAVLLNHGFGLCTEISHLSELNFDLTGHLLISSWDCEAKDNLYPQAITTLEELREALDNGLVLNRQFICQLIDIKRSFLEEAITNTNTEENPDISTEVLLDRKKSLEAIKGILRIPYPLKTLLKLFIVGRPNTYPPENHSKVLGQDLEKELQQTAEMRAFIN